MVTKLRVHFDLNRTVLMSDAVGGRSMENTVNYLLAECTWGYVKNGEWICVSKEPSSEPPSSSEPLITYKKFVDSLYPYESLQGQKDPAIVDQVKKTNKAMKKQRTALQSAFTNQENGPGHAIFASFENVMEKLHFPEGDQREAAKKAAEEMDECRLKEAWGAGRYYLLPSFLNFLFHAAENDTYKYEIVFRTFGDDIPEVAREIDYLIAGKHPLYPGKHLPSSFKVSTPYGTFYRDGYESDGTMLAIGTLEKVPFQSTNTEASVKEFYSKNEDVKLVKGFKNIEAAIDEMLATRQIIGLRDYWEWWSAHAEHEDYGKLLLVGSSSVKSHFYDDHVEDSHAHIVDVRDVNSGTVVPFHEAIEKYISRVEPYFAIADSNYYIKTVTQWASSA